MSSLTPILALLGAELGFVAAAIFGAFRLRHRLGLGPLFIFLGACQVLSVILASTVYFPVSESMSISPGSSVFFTASLATALLVYLREDIPRTRALIFSVVAVNVLTTSVLWLTWVQLQTLDVNNLLGVPEAMFEVNVRIFVVGTVGLLATFLLLIILYEFLERVFPGLPQSLKIIVSLGLILTVDSFAFTIGSFLGTPLFSSVLAGQLVGKVSAAVLFGVFMSLYLRFVEPETADAEQRTESFEVLSILTYRERYEIVRGKLEEERAASRAKTRFLAHVSHELRTPLNAILGFTKLLLSPKPPETDKRRLYLLRVFDNAEHLLHLINDLLDLSKIEAGKLELASERIEVSRLVEETIDQVRSQAMEKGLEISLEISGEPFELEGDPIRLKQVLINLIGNAVKFSTEGGVNVRLVNSTSGPDRRIEVSDTGIGIPKSAQAHIFEAFAQADTSTSRSFGGTGLGLAICRALCDQMGYRLEFESIEGHGSTFAVVFPQTLGAAELHAATRLASSATSG